MKFALLTLILSILFILNSHTQEAPKVKFEKVTEEDLKTTVFENDTSAAAVILYDEGEAKIVYSTSLKRFMLNYSRFIRVKVLKQSGTSFGTFPIVLSSSSQNKDEIHDIKGISFNLENGKIIKSELKKESIKIERENKYYEMVRIALPNVKVGSVFDLKYEITSNKLQNLPTWRFQYNIPVKWSQLYIEYPEFFKYNHSTLGYHSLCLNSQDTKPESIKFTSKVQSSSSGFQPSQSQIVNNIIDYMANTFKYAAKDVPAMKEEPYLTTIENYSTKIKFELSSINFTRIGGESKAFTSSWRDIVNELLADEDFGGMMRNSKQVNELVETLTKNIEDPQQKLTVLYNFVIKNIAWDKSITFMPSKSLKKIIDDKKGNSADINLLLNAMLSEANIEAFPVILSTRSHGVLRPAHASLTDCNYLILKAVINSKPILIDATEPNLPLGLLPMRCLNGDGTLVKKDEPLSVKISNPKSDSKSLTTLELKDGKFCGIINSRLFGFSAFSFREAVKESGSEKEYFEKIRKNTTVNYSDHTFTNLDSIHLPVTVKYVFSLTSDNEKDADIIYLTPIVDKFIEKNPFSSPKREYPIDFGVPFSSSQQITIAIPDGYKAEEIPKDKSFTLADKSATFIYQITQLGNNIMLNIKFSVDKPMFLPAEYEFLKSFYDLVIQKQSEQIVLKKI